MMILALHMSHFPAAVTFALFASVVLGITQRDNVREMFRYGAYCFAMAMGGLFLAGWLMWFLHH